MKPAAQRSPASPPPRSARPCVTLP